MKFREIRHLDLNRIHVEGISPRVPHVAQTDMCFNDFFLLLGNDNLLEGVFDETVGEDLVHDHDAVVDVLLLDSLDYGLILIHPKTQQFAKIEVVGFFLVMGVAIFEVLKDSINILLRVLLLLENLANLIVVDAPILTCLLHIIPN